MLPTENAQIGTNRGNSFVVLDVNSSTFSSRTFAAFESWRLAIAVLAIYVAVCQDARIEDNRKWRWTFFDSYMETSLTCEEGHDYPLKPQ